MRESQMEKQELNGNNSNGSKIEPKNQSDFQEINTKDKLNSVSPKSNNNLILGIVIGVIATLLGTKLMAGSGNNSQPQPSESAVNQETVARVSQSVTTTKVELTQIPSTLSANGTVTAQELAPVMSQSDGLQITQVLVEEGDLVTKGQVLMRLDDTILKAQLTQAQAQVRQAQARLAELKAGARQEEIQRVKQRVKIAEADVLQAQSDLKLAETRLERNRQLQEEGAIAQDRFDEIANNRLVKKSNLEQAKARLQQEKQQLSELQTGTRPEVIAQAEASLAQSQAQVNLINARLAETDVIAPVGGRIAERNARVGDVTSAFNSTKLFTIIEDNQLELQLKIPETQLNAIELGQKVKVTSSSNNINLTGIVEEINPIIDAESRQGIVKVNLPQRDNLQIGMFLQGEIVTQTKSSLTVPMNAVLPQKNGEGKVFILQPDNSVKAQTVTMGEILTGDRLEIIDGLSPQETIVIKGLAYLKDGDRVEVISNK